MDRQYDEWKEQAMQLGKTRQTITRIFPYDGYHDCSAWENDIQQCTVPIPGVNELKQELGISEKKKG